MAREGAEREGEGGRERAGQGRGGEREARREKRRVAMYTVKTAKLPEDVRVALHVVTELELLFLSEKNTFPLQ